MIECQWCKCWFTRKKFIEHFSDCLDESDKTFMDMVAVRFPEIYEKLERDTMPKDKVEQVDLTIPTVVYALFKKGQWPVCIGSSAYYSTECGRYDRKAHRGHSILVYEDYNLAIQSAREGDIIIAFRSGDTYKLQMIPT